MVFVATFFGSNPMEIIYGFPPLLTAGTWLPILSLLPAATSAVFAAVAWRQGYRESLGTVQYVLVVVAIPVFVWQLQWWHLLAR